MVLYALQTIREKQRVGYSHLMLTFWMLIQIIPVFTNKILLDVNYHGDDREELKIYQKTPIVSIGPHVSTISLVILLWLIVGRLKRVEVQVVQGDQETTHSMFKKLKHLVRFYSIFICAVVTF